MPARQGWLQALTCYNGGCANILRFFFTGYGAGLFWLINKCFIVYCLPRFTEMGNKKVWLLCFYVNRFLAAMFYF